MAQSAETSAGPNVGLSVGPSVGLTSELLLHRGDFTLDAALTVAAGETLALLGPNGSGKSTLLAAIAGLLTPERGVVEVNGCVLTSVGGSGRARVVAPHDRKVGLLGQDPLLFPHLSALENVAFGARARGVSAALARQMAAEWLNLVGLSSFAARLPRQLSGGQQQRVAIARALAAEPDVLLLDEPMAALDVQNASTVRTLLRERLSVSKLPTIVVTHDVVDAMVLADRVAIMDDGRIVDIGDTATVLGKPKNEFAANLVGLNLMHGILAGDGSVRAADGRRLRGHSVDATPLSAGEKVIAAFPPTAVRVSVRENSSGAASARGASDRVASDRVASARGASARGASDRGDGFSWHATVGVLEPAVRGIRVPFLGETFATELTTAELLSSGVREGMAVTVSVNPALVTVYRPRSDAHVMRE
ncbi:MAG: ABC transporter ATP-binding protein [Terrimesophilobacter sp.]